MSLSFGVQFFPHSRFSPRRMTTFPACRCRTSYRAAGCGLFTSHGSAACRASYWTAGVRCSRHMAAPLAGHPTGMRGCGLLTSHNSAACRASYRNAGVRAAHVTWQRRLPGILQDCGSAGCSRILFGRTAFSFHFK